MQGGQAGMLLSRLDKVKATGPGKWIACCPAHEDKRPSLSIADRDGKVLIKCWAGCPTVDVLTALGIEWDDLFPKMPDEQGIRSRPRQPWSGHDALAMLAHEAVIVLLAGEDMLNGEIQSEEDRERLSVAVERIEAAVVKIPYRARLSY